MACEPRAFFPLRGSRPGPKIAIFDAKQKGPFCEPLGNSGNASTEGKMISFFTAHRIKGWQRNYKIYGKPDFVLRK